MKDTGFYPGIGQYLFDQYNKVEEAEETKFFVEMEKGYDLKEEFWNMSVRSCLVNRESRFYITLIIGTLDENEEYKEGATITRIELFKPEYIEFRDGCRILTRKERDKFISIVNNHWGEIMKDYKDLFVSLEDYIKPPRITYMPDYSKLPTLD